MYEQNDEIKTKWIEQMETFPFVFNHSILKKKSIIIII